MQHLWTARHAARLCREREAQIVEQRSLDTELRSHAMTSVFFAAAFLEALINDVILEVIDDAPPSTRTAGIPSSSKAAFEKLWARERSILGKYQGALKAVGKTQFPDSQNSFGDAQLLVELRNHFVHFKPKWRDADDEHDLERKLKSASIVENQQPIGGHWFPNKALGAGLADWSCDVATRFADSWWTRIGLQGRVDASFNALPAP